LRVCVALARESNVWTYCGANSFKAERLDSLTMQPMQ
jgi:hypothetical protein